MKGDGRRLGAFEAEGADKNEKKRQWRVWGEVLSAMSHDHGSKARGTGVKGMRGETIEGRRRNIRAHSHLNLGIDL